MTEKAFPSDKVLTNDDLNALAVRLIEVTSRFQFIPDGSIEANEMCGGYGRLARRLDALADDLMRAVEPIQRAAQHMHANARRGRAERYLPPPKALIGSARS